MSLRIRADPIDRDIELMLSESLSPKAQSAALAEFAKEQIEEAKQTNRRALGRDPRYTVSVDGREGAALESVKPNGYVIAEFELVNDVLEWIAENLERHSPFKTGRYQRSHILVMDGQSFVFVNQEPYAAKIETGSSSQAPDGVYQAVATLGQGRFGNIATIKFGYRAFLGGEPISQELAHSFGGWFFGRFHQERAASGVRESRLAKEFGKTAHNISNVRFPSIIVTVGK